ncbi:MAG: hypothetical protein IK115_01745 [Lachnospiraceae bacterium]|nr:hypothetical protein [Lachnospiraceae bacterium]
MKSIKNIIIGTMGATLILGGLTGCSGTALYNGFEVPVQPESTLSPVGNLYREELTEYGDEGTADTVLDTFTSDNGACTIKKLSRYYDVTLDYENYSPEEAGRAYAETIMKAFPDYHAVIEPYIYENIYAQLKDLTDDFSAVETRVFALTETLRDKDREELLAFAEELSGGVHGYAEDGVISYEEAVTYNLIPEALRGTACSALSLWGEKTASGDPITVRLLDWHPGSNNQMGRTHAVIHAQKGEQSYTGISFLGFVSIVSAVNNDGVFAAILDVGSLNEDYSCEDRKCYTYDLKYALEEFATAKEVGEFMVANSADYTWSHNLIISDKDHSFCAEDAVKQLQESGKGYSILRDADTPLLSGLSWDNKDSLCVVNSFASEGNQDFFTGNAHNLVRFNKYNEWVASKDRFTVGELKTMLTKEKVNQGLGKGEAAAQNVRRRGTVQIIIVDYHTGRIQVSFISPEGASDDVVFTDIGTY